MIRWPFSFEKVRVYVSTLPNILVHLCHIVITPGEAKLCRLLKIGTFCWPLLVLAHLSWFNEEGWTYFCRFVFVCFTLKYKLREMLKFNNKKIIVYLLYKFSSIYKITPPHLPLRGKVGQLSKRKSLLCWSIYIISFNFTKYIYKWIVILFGIALCWR